mgnify:CR=1 FL=1
MGITPLLFEQLKGDERVVKAKALLKSALQSYQSSCQSVKGPLESRVSGFKTQLRHFSKNRGGALYFPYLGSGFGNGALVELADGSIKYDFISGIGATFAHSRSDMLALGVDAIIQNTVMQGNLQQNIGSVALLEKMLSLSGFDHGVLSTSGVMAVENGLKLLFHYRAPASRLLAFERCFMGRTLAASQLTDKAQNRQGLPINYHVDYIPFYDDRDAVGSTQRAVALLEQLLQRYPGQYAGMCMELIQGEGGYYPGSSAYFNALIEVLQRENVPVLVDEVQTFGRVPSLFAFKEFDLDGKIDILTIGKLSQVCATLYCSALKPAPGLISQTFTSSTHAIESSQFILECLSSPEYSGSEGKIHRIGTYFKSKLTRLSQQYPDYVKGPFGYGLMVAFTPFDGSYECVSTILKALFEKGVMAFVSGRGEYRIRFLVPIGAVTESDIDSVMDIILSVILWYSKMGVKKKGGGKK